LWKKKIKFFVVVGTWSVCADKYDKGPSLGIRDVRITQLTDGQWVFDRARMVHPVTLRLLTREPSKGPYDEATAPKYVNPFVNYVLGTIFNPTEHDGETQAKKFYPLVWG
jgi:hypothetical protein